MTPDFHFEVLPAPQRKLWKRLAAESFRLECLGYYLAGGTALALQTGHRRSMDFDFFSRKKNTAEEICELLERFSGYTVREMNADTLHAEIGGVKVSFIGAYRYLPVGKFVELDKIRLASVADIGLMKLLAITHRATLRDYMDLAAIVRDHVPLDQLLKKCREKYGKTFNVLLPLRALASFEDLDPETPLMLDKSLVRSWRSILKEAVKKAA